MAGVHGRKEGLQGSCVEARLGEHVAQVHSKQLQVGLVQAAEHVASGDACMLLVQRLQPLRVPSLGCLRHTLAGQASVTGGGGIDGAEGVGHQSGCLHSNVQCAGLEADEHISKLPGNDHTLELPGIGFQEWQMQHKPKTGITSALPTYMRATTESTKNNHQLSPKPRGKAAPG